MPSRGSPSTSAAGVRSIGTTDVSLERARVLAKTGQVAKLRRLLERAPPDVETCCALSFEAHRAGHLEAALVCSARALAGRPTDARLHFMHAGLLKAKGQFDACLGAYARAIELAPDYVDAWISRGVAFRAKGDEDMALDCCRRALELAPGNVPATINLGNLLVDKGQPEQAEAAFREALTRAPDSPDAHLNLGRLLNSLGRTLEGIQHLQRGLELRPGDLASAVLLAGLLNNIGAGEAAIPLYQYCLTLDAGSWEANLGLSAVLRQKGRIAESMAAAKRAIELSPRDAQGFFALADALVYAGDTAEAQRILESAQWNADLPVRAVSSYLLYSNYFDTLDAPQVFARHRDYGRVLKVPTEPRPHANVPDPERPLRIAYISHDFRRHSVAYFAEPVLAGHSEAFHVTCYFTRSAGDAVTERLKGHVDAFVHCQADSDEELAARIRADGIDILVDLSGHSGGNRMTLFTLGPAPVQMTWLGYPTTTGLESIGYRISDAEVDPPGSDGFSVERVLRIPGSYYCYRPPADAPEVAEPPALRQGWITFGSFNHLAKVTATTVGLWARVLNAVPHSRLMVKARGLSDDAVKERLAARFSGAGIARDRLHLVGWEDQAQDHLALYGQMDIGFDTFPYNGATTTCEALWMGVPVVTLAGSTHASRMGRSLLKAAGLPALVASNPDEFVSIASALASDPRALAGRRAALRSGLLASRLLDEPAFVGDLEAAYRQAWRAWCAKG